MRTKPSFLPIVGHVIVAIILRIVVVPYGLEASGSLVLQILALFAVFGVGIAYVFRGTANVIEETTDVLKDRTGLAGGFLQAFGTAFPDMIIGVVAAIASFSVRDTDAVRAINLAILAAATTFGSNVYNIIHAAWCVNRQNVANHLKRTIQMFPGIAAGGMVTPIFMHATKPSGKEMDGAIRVLTALTLLTGFTATTMVVFGRVDATKLGLGGDVYQLAPFVGIALFLLCAATLYIFRKSDRPDSPLEDVAEAEQAYRHASTLRIWFDLAISGIAILLAAESMVKGMELLSHLTHLPFVVTGILAGLIGCFGEMLVVHNFSVHPKGRIGDAIVGVAMDNIVTTMGAAIVAMIGGIFLGGNSLILIFVVILTANTVLIEQIARLKNSLK